MTKNEFLRKLAKKIHTVQKDERLKYLVYYSEMIDDRLEEIETIDENTPECLLNESEILADLGIDKIASEILEDAKIRNVMQKKHNPMVITLLILGSPLWLSFLVLGLALVLILGVVVLTLVLIVGAVVLTVMICVLAGLVSLCVSFGAAVIALIGAGVFTFVSLFVMLPINPSTACLVFGLGLIALGLGMLLSRPVVLFSIFSYKAYIFLWKKLIYDLGKVVKASIKGGKK